MDITTYVAGVNSAITNQTAPATISPATVGGKLNDLAAITKTAVELKADAVAGKQLSTEDYTTAEKNKLASLATTAGGIIPWTAVAQPINTQVNYNGKDWISSVATLATDVPGVSVKWQPRLTAYNGLRMVKTLNLYNNASALVDTILNNGVTQAFTGFTTSDYIPVTPSTIYTAYTGKAFATIPTFRYHWYTIAGAIINPTFNSGVNGSTEAAPSNAAFIRISAATIVLSNQGMLVAGTTAPTVYVRGGNVLQDSNGFASVDFVKDALADPAGVTAITSAVQNTENLITPFNASFLQLGVNRLDVNASDFQVGFALDKNSGASTANTDFSVTGYMAVTPGQTYYFSRDGVTQVGLSLSAWFDKNKTYISAVTYTNNVTVAPAGAAYLRASAQVAGFTFAVGYMFVQGTALPGRFIPFGYDFDTTKIHTTTKLGAWDGKNWIALGDSITNQATYFPNLIAETGLKNIQNLGVVGALLKTRADALTSDMMTNCDLITVLGGTNDYGHGGQPLGTIDDSNDANTFYGNIGYVINKILTLKPTVRIVFFTPTNRGFYSTEPNWTPPQPNNNGLTMANISEAIRLKCRSLSVPVLDLFGESGFNSYTFSTYTADGLHPNTLSGAKLGTLMGKFINRINP